MCKAETSKMLASNLDERSVHREDIGSGCSCKVDCIRCIKYSVSSRCFLSISVSDAFGCSAAQHPTSCSCYLSSLPPPWFARSSAWWNFPILVKKFGQNWFILYVWSSRHGLEMSWAPVHADSLANALRIPRCGSTPKAVPATWIQIDRTIQLIETQKNSKDVPSRVCRETCSS